MSLTWKRRQANRKSFSPERQPKRVCARRVFQPWLERLEERVLLAQVFWINPASGDWDTTSNWSTHNVPSVDDDAVINQTGITVTHSTGTDSALSITSNASIALTGGTLNVGGGVKMTGGTFNLQGGTLAGATLVSGSKVELTSNGGTLDGVTANTDLDLTSNVNVFAHVVHGLTLKGTAWLGNAAGSTYGGLLFDGTQTLSGTGTVVFGKNSNNFLRTYNTTANDPTADIFTIGAGITVRGSAGVLGDSYYGATIVNQGTLAADDSGGTSSFADDTGFDRGYTMNTASAIDVSGLTNPAPQVVYQTAHANDYYGPAPFTYTLTNLTAGAAYTLRLHFAEIQNVGVGGRTFDVNVNGTQVLKAFDIVAAAGAVNKAVVRQFTATADATGKITVNFQPDGGSYDPQVNGIELLSGTTVVQAINAGLLPGGTIAVHSASFVNQGQISAGAAEILALQGSWRNSGTLAVLTAGTLNLDGTFTTAGLGTLHHTGGTVNLTGTLDNTATMLALNATTGSWNLLGGKLLGGSYSASGGAELVFTTSGGTLDGVTANSDLDLASDFNVLAHVVHGLTLKATAWLGDASGATYGGLYFDGTQTLSGTGTVVFGKNGANFLRTFNTTANDPTSDTLTIGAGVTLRGSAGLLGDGYQRATIVNQGILAADDSGGASSFAYDTGFDAGYSTITASVIDTSGVTSPAPQVVYQTAHYNSNYGPAPFTYTLTNLTAGAAYTLRLHFAELQNVGVGDRKFHVNVNGTRVLTDFDIVAAAGAINKAVVRQFSATADAAGKITVNFQPDGGFAQVNGIELLSGTAVVQAVNAGLLPGGTIAVTPASFVNQGQITAGAAETVSLQGSWRNAAGATISANNAVLNLGEQYSSSTLTWSNAGTINALQTPVNLGGLFTFVGLGTLNHTGGSVNLTGTLDNTGNTLALNATTGSWNLLGGKLLGGSYSASGGAELVFTNYGGTLDGVTANGDLDLATNNSATAHVVHGLTLKATAWLGDASGATYGGLYFDGTQTLTGTGPVVFGKNGANFLRTFNTTPNDPTSDTLTIGAGVTLRGSAGLLGDGYYAAMIVNQGILAADDSGGTSSFTYDTGFDAGYSTSTGSVIDTSGVTSPAPQVVYQTAHYNISFGPAPFTYTLTNLAAGTAYTLRLHFAEIQNASVGGRKFHVNVNGTRVLTDFDIVAAAGAINKAVVRQFTATADAGGKIAINFQPDGGGYGAEVNGIELLSGTTVVQAINAGLLAGGTIAVTPASFVNQGQVTAGAAETVSLQGSWRNAAGATITANDATLNLGDQYSSSTLAWSNAGTITAVHTAVNLGGLFTFVGLGTLHHTGGSVNLTGTLDNTGTTLTLDATTGSWNLLGGRLLGGKYSAGGAELVFTSSGGILDGVTAISDLDLATNNGVSAHVVHGLTLNGTAWLGDASGATYGGLYFDGTQTLGGTGAAVFGKNGSNFLRTYNTTTFNDPTTDVLTIAAGITVRGSAGLLGDGYYQGTIVNQGTLAADDSGGVSRFTYDTSFDSGDATNTPAFIDISGVTNPAPESVYQTARHGSFYSSTAPPYQGYSPFSYTLAKLTAGASYTVRLHFADFGIVSANLRPFDVSLNGTKVLTNFDIVGAAGAVNKAVVKEFAGTADGNGTIALTFAAPAGTGNMPQVCGIELLSGSTVVQAINAGLLAGGTITVSTAAFVNQGQVIAGAAETLSLQGSWRNAAGATISASAATLNLGDQSSSSTLAWSNAGTITVLHTNVNLGGMFTFVGLGTFNHTGGSVNLTGTLDNTGTTLALDATTGSWNLLGGRLLGGSYAASGGAELVFTNYGGILDGVTAISDLDLATTSAFTHVVHGLTLKATAWLGSASLATYGGLYFDGTQTLGGTGTVVFGKNGSNFLNTYNTTANDPTSDTLTIGAGITLRGSTGLLGDGYYGATIVNQGTLAADDSGGSSHFAYDSGFDSGYTANTAAPIDTYGLTNPAPQAVYQTARYNWSFGPAPFTYTLANLTAGAAYTLRLHFAEIQNVAVGDRKFHVNINGARALTDFDLVAAAGAINKAVVREFAATADAAGKITINFQPDGGAGAQVNGIELLSGSTVVQAINAGLLAGGTITVSTAAFVNQGQVIAGTAGETLAVSPTGIGTFTNSGILDIGAESKLAVEADFTQTSSGTLAIQLGGSPPSGPFSQMNLSGNAVLDGTLSISLVNGYVPQAGDRFQVMSYTQKSGTFASIRGLGAFLEAVVSDTAVRINSLVNTADLAVSGISIPSSGISGQPVTVTFSVQNKVNLPATANDWFDSVYLAQGSSLDESAKLIGRVEHKSGLGALGSYTATLTAPLPGVVPSNYHVIVICDSRGLVSDPDRSNNVLASTGLIATDLTALTPGVPFLGTIDNGQDEYFRVDLTPGPVVRVTVKGATAGEAELYVRYLDMPDQTTYDQLAFQPSQQQQQLLLNGSQAGRYYLLLHGREGATGGQAFSLTVLPLAFQIVSVAPNLGGNTGPTTVTVQGSEFTPGTVVSLVGADGMLHPAAAVAFRDSTTLFATFDLTSLTMGVYGVRADSNGHTSTDAGAFTVNAGSPGQVVYNMSAPSFVRGGMQGTVTVTYENIGDTDAPAPLLALTATNGVLRFANEPSFVGTTAQFLAINSDGPAGILPPGALGHLTLYFQADKGITQGQIGFALGISADDQPIDWTGVKASYQPPGVPDTAWNVVWGNFLSRVGSTAGQLHTLLDADATYLSLLGEYTPDIERLISFELQRADDFGAITQRNTAGAFGLGWPDPTVIKLTTASSGNVTIQNSGQVRSFFIQSDASYRGVPGDAANLILKSGIYTLRETDGSSTVFNADGTLNYTQDTNNNRVTAGYAGGRLTSFTDSLHHTVVFQYEAHGKISQVTDAVNRITTYHYDPTGELLLSVTDEAGTSSYTYVSGQGAARENALQSIAYPDGTHVLFTYDDLGRLQSQSRDGGAEALNYSYDSAGGVTVTNADGSSVFRCKHRRKRGGSQPRVL